MNVDDVRAAYKFLAHEHETEIRLIDPLTEKFVGQHHVTTEDEFIKVCQEHDGKCNIYAGINERCHLGTTRKDIISVRTVILDIDPIRNPVDMQKEASTDEELHEAEKTASQIQYDLVLQGFNPVKVMSGNGYQIWLALKEIKVDDSNREIVEGKLKLFQNMIAQKYSDRKVKIDSIGDLPRIIKVIGTMSVKGHNTLERPHRLSCSDGDFTRKEDAQFTDYIMNLKPAIMSESIVDMEPEEREEFGLIPLTRIFEEDTKMLDLYLGEWEKHGFQSRSEAEISLIVKLLCYGYGKKQIFKVLDQSRIGKWNESESYRQHTYKAALEFYRNKLTNLQQVYDVFDKWMYFPDKERLDIMLAVAISRKMTGKPLWLIFVSPSGEGKSEQTMALKGKNTMILHEWTSKTLVSGMKGVEDMAPKLNNKLVIIPDFGQLLMLDPKEKASIFSQLRELYDGRAGRMTGSGKEARYEGIRVTIIACSTPAIDGQILIFQDLGTRELLWRTEPLDEDKRKKLMAKMKANMGKEEEMVAELDQVVNDFINAHSPSMYEASNEVDMKIQMLVDYICLMRATAECDSYSGELRNFVYPEAPTRIYMQMLKLYMCLKSLDKNYSDDKILSILKHITKSSVNPVRSRVLKAIIEKHFNDESFGMNQVAEEAKVGVKTAYREMNILFALDILKRNFTEDYGRIKYQWWLNRNHNVVKNFKEITS